MKVLVQRVARARVVVEGAEIASIGRGLLLLVGVEQGDDESDAASAAEKMATLRIFPDELGRMNRDVSEVSGEALVVPQFTLAGSVRRGRRPSFDGAAPPDLARTLVERLCGHLAARGVPVRQGRFGADMKVELLNDGPVTFLFETRP